MDRSHWFIPLTDRRYVLRWGNSVLYEDDRYSRQFAWIPELFRDPLDWQDTRITLGGLFADQCVQDVQQLLEWMGIEHRIDLRLVGCAR